MIDALWTGQAGEMEDAIREFNYLDTWGPVAKGIARLRTIQRLGNEGRVIVNKWKPGWIYIDRLVRFNEEKAAPELILTVRTIATTPRNRSPVTDTAPLFHWIGNIARPIATSELGM